MKRVLVTLLIMGAAFAAGFVVVVYIAASEVWGCDVLIDCLGRAAYEFKEARR